MKIIQQQEVFIPGGGYIYHLNHRIMEGDCQVDHGPRWAVVPDMYVDQYPITNAMYYAFLNKSRYVPEQNENFLKHWGDSGPFENELNMPVTWVSRADANAYAHYYDKELPTDIQWQYFACGPHRYTWPWGNQYDKHKLNSDRMGKLTPVDAFPKGVNEHGLFDLAGNAWEMTDIVDDGMHKFMLLRGGSYYRAQDFWHAFGGPHPNNWHLKCPLLNEALNRNANVGFRCIRRMENANI